MYFIIILFHLCLVLSVISKNYLPKFESLPPPLVYYSDNFESTRNLSCKAWPADSDITFYSTARMTDENVNSARQSQFIESAPLHPLSSSFIVNGSLVLRDAEQVRPLAKLDLHCLAKTAFGAVISRPFRVIEAKIGNFPASNGISAGEAQKVTKYFMQSNVAYVDCMPPESTPPAKIEFQLNGTNVPIMSSKATRYHIVKRPNSRRVVLLIEAFQPHDQGYYRCVASNPITGETKTDPLVQQLKIKIPRRNEVASIKMSMAGNELNSTKPNTQQDVITVREGLNVTLFCVMEGAPPPHITTFKMRALPNSEQYRHISHKELGFLTINKVSPDDEDTYYCSETSVSDIVQLKVKKRLGITQGPKDIRVSNLGQEARFTCLSSDPNIMPQWYFNGKLRTQGQDSSLHIANVRKEDLGVYQCVARSQDEWVTHIATLSLKSEPLISHTEKPAGKGSSNAMGGGQRGSSGQSKTHGDSRGSRIKKHVEVQSRRRNADSKSPKWNIIEDLAPPRVSLIDDNLAVLLQWRPATNTGVVVYYRVQFVKRKVESDQWSPIITLDNEITDNFFYVTSASIEAQHIYKFKIAALLISSSSRYSEWSREISFAHIYPVHPVIQKFESVNTTHIIIHWMYPSWSKFPVSQYDILVRSVRQQGPKVVYSPFTRVHVANSNATQAYLGPLEPGTRYQFVVYGITHAGPTLARKITQYSPETHFNVPAVSTPPSIWGLKNNSESNTRLMFIILGSLAGLMMLVIVVLVLMCYCRERKSIVRLNRYKDPAKIIHSDPNKAAHSSFLLASMGAAAAAANGNNNNHHHNNHIHSNHHHHNKHEAPPYGSMERASLLGSNHPADTVYCQQKRQPPSGGSGHDMSEEASSLHDTPMAMVGAIDNHHSLPHHHHNHHGTGTVGPGYTTPQPPAVTYYKISGGPASLPAGSLMRPSAAGANSHMHAAQYAPLVPAPQQIYYTAGGGGGAAFMYQPSQGGAPVAHMLAGGHGNHQMVIGMNGVAQAPSRQQHEMFNDLRGGSQDGGESVYSYFSQTSNAATGAAQAVRGPDYGAGGAGAMVEAGSQTVNNTSASGQGGPGASHRHHRRKRRKTNHSGSVPSEGGEHGGVTGPPHQQPIKMMVPRMMGAGGGAYQHQLIGREVMYDTPPPGAAQHDPRLVMMSPPPGMVLVQSASHGGGVDPQQQQSWAAAAHLNNNNTLTRRGTPTLFVEPPRIRDYSEYGIPQNQHGGGPPGNGVQMVAPIQQLAHLSQQNLHLHNQNLSGGYRDVQA